MIMPFMENGDVKLFLKSKRGDIIIIDDFPKVNIIILLLNNLFSSEDIYQKILLYNKLVISWEITKLLYSKVLTKLLYSKVLKPT